MAAKIFTSESYAEGKRFGAWQEAIAVLDLRASGRAGQLDAHATAITRGAGGSVLVARLAAAPQTLKSRNGIETLPLLLRAEAEAFLTDASGHEVTVPAGAMLVLPRVGTWDLWWPQGLRALALSVRGDAFPGRRVGHKSDGTARILADVALETVLSQMLAGVAERLDVLTATDWAAIEASLPELVLAVLSQHGSSEGDAEAGTAQAALLYRIHRFIERRLDDPRLSPARVAEAEGISERYLQKTFETAGDSFSHYLRERRLQRAATDLTNPAEAASAVSEIAFRSGFNDAAHFSRAFRERFAVSPRDYRRQEAERQRAVAGAGGQRGWPRERPGAARQMDMRAQPMPAVAEPPQAVAAVVRHHLPVDAERVHWGFFSRSLAPQLSVASGDVITVETLTQHATDDPARMIVGDPGAESVFRWTAHEKAVSRRGAGPMDGSIYGRGAGEGFGVHICTGPIAVRDAQPGDVLEVRILDIVPRPSQATGFAGRSFGSGVAAWWGYHYPELVSEPSPREVVTIYEIHAGHAEPYAQALYSYRWTPQTDPFGTIHRTYDYPGVPVDPDTVMRRSKPLAGIRIPLRPHFGVVAVAPRESELVDSVPPAYFGGNIDNWRLGKGAAVYLPISVPGALLSLGDPHAAQGDGEVGGTAIECSLTGTVKLILHKKVDLEDGNLSDLNYPLIETERDWVLTGFSHPNYLAEFGPKGRSEVYAKSSLDTAMKDAFRKARRFLMRTAHLTEDEAVALMSASVDFGVTQVVDGNWGVHAIIPKHLCATLAP